MDRRCTFCKEIKDLERDFYRDKTRGHGRAAICKTCTSIKRRKYRETERQRDRDRRRRKKSSKKYRDLALVVLGSACVCCGEDFKDYLEIDHIYSSGRQHREELKGSQGVYRWIIANPDTDMLQLLCGNCHLYKTKYNKFCRERHLGKPLVPSKVLSIPEPQVV